MGQNHLDLNKNYDLEIDEDLRKNIEQEINIKHHKNQLKKFKKLVKKKGGKNFKHSNFMEKFDENEKGVKNISELLNLIYDNNINRDQAIQSNRTIYEVTFDVRDAVELVDVNDKEIYLFGGSSSYDTIPAQELTDYKLTFEEAEVKEVVILIASMTTSTYLYMGDAYLYNEVN